ncbi:hypothetical protein NECAME_14489 [Necator americanus]|uniref:Uncharacterized protein n=1 Tax=Necator americanus TaxID=51031 RepID=W2SMK2_NECAM|nr:hypothetical protein NECAME_14489 [Necator americanus]ETN70855.1 hypothetical protein NECAME_14489 [Necator americanus]
MGFSPRLWGSCSLRRGEIASSNHHHPLGLTLPLSIAAAIKHPVSPFCHDKASCSSVPVSRVHYPEIDTKKQQSVSQYRDCRSKSDMELVRNNESSKENDAGKTSVLSKITQNWTDLGEQLSAEGRRVVVDQI